MLVLWKRDHDSPSTLGTILWYSNPISVEREMQPPMFTAYKSMIPASKKYLLKAFYLIFREGEAYVALRGSIQKTTEGCMSFETGVESFLLSFEECHDLNVKLLLLSGRCGKVKSNTTIPILDIDDCVLRERKKVQNADKLWVAGLLLSRVRVTCMGIRRVWKTFFVKKGLLLDEENKKTEATNIFYAWFPSPKPSDLSEWLAYLSKKLVSSFPPNWVSESTPFVEGFYQIAFRSAEKGECEYDATAKLIFSDGAKVVQRCFTDYPYKPSAKELAAGFVDEKDRVRISISLALRYSAPESVCNSDWGYQGHMAMGYLFLLPGDLEAKDFCEPIRSSSISLFEKKNKIEPFHLRKQGALNRLVTCAHKDSQINASECIRKAALDTILSDALVCDFKTQEEKETASTEVIPTTMQKKDFRKTVTAAPLDSDVSLATASQSERGVEEMLPNTANNEKVETRLRGRSEEMEGGNSGNNQATDSGVQRTTDIKRSNDQIGSESPNTEVSGKRKKI